MELQAVLGRFNGVRPCGDGFTAKCPAHDDKKNSLSVGIGADGKILLQCFAGCSVQAITERAGLRMTDLFQTEPDKPARPQVIAEYDYVSADGKLLAQKQRRLDKSFIWRVPDGDSWKYSRKGVTTPLFNLPAVVAADTVYLVEGEKDCQTLADLGYTATSLPDGAKSKWQPAYGEQLRGKQVIILPDNDDPGAEYAAMCANNLSGVAASVRVVDLNAVWPDLPPKGDITDAITSCGAEIMNLVAEKARSAGETSVQCKKRLLMSMAEVDAKTARYLVKPYLPLDMLSILGGVSGAGKTYLALSIAAAISKGESLPFQKWYETPPEPGNVYYFTQENDPNIVLRPRLEKLGADLSRIFILPLEESGFKQITLNDPVLEEMAADVPPALIVFDPIQSYLGAGVEMNKANEVRPILDSISDYARRHGCSIVLISHVSKPGAGNPSALDRLLGSSDFRNTARSIIVVGHDPENSDTRVFAHAKNSIGEPGKSQRYHIDSEHGVVFDGECDLTADEIIKQAQPPRKREKPAVTLSQAMNLIQGVMGSKGYAPLGEIETMKACEGISHGTLQNAKKELGVQSVLIGQPSRRVTWWISNNVDINTFKQERAKESENVV